MVAIAMPGPAYVPKYAGNPTAARLMELFTYSITTGKLYRAVTKGYKALEGTEVNTKHIQGYYEVSVDGNRCLLHRLIWCLVTNEWPTSLIDHVNGVRTDNRWLNLREASTAENTRNGIVRSQSITGVKGVSPSKCGKKFVAVLHLVPKRKFLGTFSTVEEAKEAWNTAAKLHHGEFYHE